MSEEEKVVKIQDVEKSVEQMEQMVKDLKVNVYNIWANQQAHEAEIKKHQNHIDDLGKLETSENIKIRDLLLKIQQKKAELNKKADADGSAVQ